MPTAEYRDAPPFDRELVPALVARVHPATMTLDMMLELRAAPQTPPIGDLLAPRDLVSEDRTIPGPDGEPDLVVSIFATRDHSTPGLGIYHIHGGGMVGGNRFTGIERALDWVRTFDAVAVTVEYRLAPEHPDPAPVHDCLAGLAWMGAHATELSFDPDQLIIAGGSAGGGLAAGTALLARDTGGPPLIGQVLICPMLDDRDETVSSRQIQGIGVWDRASNQVGWRALLGDRCGTQDVSIYAAPARATDLSGLPPTYIDCGSAEVFRDEDVAYASAIWAAGGVAELHVWAGGFHGFDGFAPDAALSVAARAARAGFIRGLVVDDGVASLG